jgi:hypothetical protein
MNGSLTRTGIILSASNLNPSLQPFQISVRATQVDRHDIFFSLYLPVYVIGNSAVDFHDECGFIP